MTEAFYLHNAWCAIWRGQVANATFTSKGAAMAWISVCNSKKKFHH